MMDQAASSTPWLSSKPLSFCVRCSVADLASNFHPALSAGQLRKVRLDLASTARGQTILEGDVNGDGQVDFQISFTGLLHFVPDDFILSRGPNYTRDTSPCRHGNDRRGRRCSRG
jgi:hypothetical protein